MYLSNTIYKNVTIIKTILPPQGVVSYFREVRLDSQMNIPKSQHTL